MKKADNESLEKISRIALKIAKILYENGASAERIINSVELFMHRHSDKNMQCTAFSRSMQLTVETGDHVQTRMVRTAMPKINMQLLGDVSRFLRRRRDDMSLDEIDHQLDELSQRPPPFTFLTTVIMTALGCAAFSFLFGGTYTCFVATFGATSFTFLIRRALSKYRLNPLLIIFLLCVSGPFCAGLLSQGISGRNDGLAMISCILFLVPGVLMINAVEDMLKSHVVLGTARFVFSLWVVIAAAMGMSVALFFLSVPVDAAPTSMLSCWRTDWLFAGLAAAGFAVFFSVPKRRVPWCILLGACGHALRTVIAHQQVSLVAATFIGCLFIGICAEILSHRLNIPMTLFAVPAAITMIPGSFAFRAMAGFLHATLSAPTHEILVFTFHNGTLTILVVMAMVLGITLPSLVYQYPET